MADPKEPVSIGEPSITEMIREVMDHLSQNVTAKVAIICKDDKDGVILSLADGSIQEGLMEAIRWRASLGCSAIALEEFVADEARQLSFNPDWNHAPLTEQERSRQYRRSIVDIEVRPIIMPEFLDMDPAWHDAKTIDGQPWIESVRAFEHDTLIGNDTENGRYTVSTIGPWKSIWDKIPKIPLTYRERKIKYWLAGGKFPTRNKVKVKHGNK